MKKIKLLFLLIIFYPSLTYTQNLRDVICTVYPVYDVNTVNFLKDLSKDLHKKGYEKASKLTEGKALGSFGTGFVFKDKTSNKYYVITNRHVISPARYVNLKFTVSGKLVMYERCVVLAASDELDIAIIEMPGYVEFSETLSFSQAIIKDGDDVFSAGYPGLASNPLWQFGKGIISNNLVQSDILVNNPDSYVIQHTAQVDPGSSGGPLLIQDSNESLNYSIIGVNTWKASGREGANYAIPATDVISFINKSLTKKTTDSEENLENHARKLINAAELGYSELLPYISYECISGMSVNAFMKLYKNASKYAQNEINKNFLSGLPFDGVRIAIAEAIHKDFINNKTSFLTVQNNHSNQVNVLYQQGKKTYSSGWVLEYGQWRLASFHLLSIKRLKPCNFIAVTLVSINFLYLYYVRI
ncbi:serine protease [Bacteroidales bacterium OttesenSCG-928-I21]|nr:serine protease [Bacteroidales bacterium OttesenSCG-928-I21]